MNYVKLNRVVANAIVVNDSIPLDTSALSGRPLRLVYFGRLVETKGIFDAVYAVSGLCKDGVSVSLAVAGSGPDEERLRHLIEELHLPDRVTLKGALFGAEKSKLWSECDVFVFPTRHRAGLPHALLEGMVTRTVPITCPVGAIPDVIENERHGLLVPPQDVIALAAAIRRLHENRKELIQLGEAAREGVVRCYTVARLAEDFRQLYRQL
jgi:glycosyltransferase involved in cell wall biosynthesis